MKKSVSAVCLCLSMVACGQALNGQVQRVIDGDTLVIRGTTVRLWGIDAPELSEPGGVEARERLQVLTTGREVTCIDTGERTHGRVVGRCWAGRSSNPTLNEAMVAGGYALDCYAYSGGDYRKLEPAGVRQKLTNKPYC